MQFKEDKFLHRYFKLDDDDYIIGSVGFIAETKQNELRICVFTGPVLSVSNP